MGDSPLLGRCTYRLSRAWALIGAVALQVVFLTVIHVALALVLKTEPKDERARLIEARAGLYAYNILSFVAIVLAIAIVIAALASPLRAVWSLLDAVFLSQLLLFFCIFAELVRYVVQAVSYRRGS